MRTGFSREERTECEVVLEHFAAERRGQSVTVFYNRVLHRGEGSL